MSFVLELAQLERHYRKSGDIIRALDGVSLHVAAGECVVVRGPSGSGKTTLLLAAAGLLAPTRGRVLLDGQDPYALSAERRARLRATYIGIVFQQFYLIPYLTTLENVLAPSLGAPSDNAEARAHELIDQLELSHRIHHVPGELSTGERQRTGLARALLNRPPLLLADEPTGNLDPENASRVLRHIADFARSGGAVLMVTHDDTAISNADRILSLNHGRL